MEKKSNCMNVSACNTGTGCNYFLAFIGANYTLYQHQQPSGAVFLEN